MISFDHKNNIIEYSLNGFYHRANGPARSWFNNGFEAWWLYGRLHRCYGPCSNHGGWYIHGEQIK